MRSVPSLFSRREMLFFAGAATRLRASEPEAFWERKPSAEWSLADVYRISNHSPWANPVQSWTHAMGGRRPVQPPGAAVWPPAPEFGPIGVITWESARPLREAFKTPLPWELEDLYVIGVDGIPIGGAMNVNSLRQFTVLRGRGRTKWSVRAAVAMELIRNSAVCAFGFPRSAAPIDLATDEVYFESEFGRWMIQTKFRPRDMVYHGELAV